MMNSHGLQEKKAHLIWSILEILIKELFTKVCEIKGKAQETCKALSVPSEWIKGRW